MTIEFGSHRRIATLADLARALEVPKAKLASALLASSCPEPAHSPSSSSESVTNVNVNENEVLDTRSTFPLPENVREPEGSEQDPRAERLAVYLAERFDDWKSYRFFLLVARRVPREIVLDALRTALDVPRSDIRRSRAAYFTAIIQRHLPS